MINLLNLIDVAKCYAEIRQLRWPQGVRCPHCQAARIQKRGWHSQQPHRQRYVCQACQRQFDDLTGTLLAGHHQPVTVWLVCLYLMGLNLSNAQIAAELDLAPSEAQTMTTYLREGLQARTPAVTLTGIVEIDETYLIAGHKGYPQAVAQAGRRPRRRRLKGKRGRGTLADEKPPVVGFLQRDGTLVLLVLPNVQRATIAPYVTGTIAPGTLIYTDEYGIYHQLPAWGYQHQTVNHSAGEYARDADGDGFYEIHINTLEGVWSLLRSWLRPHRGVSQEKLPAYVSFFAWVHNLRQRGQALFAGLLAALLAP